MASPHDSFFKQVFSRPAEAVGVLKAVLPPILFQQLDPSSARLVEDSLIDDHLRARHADRLFEVRLAGRETLLYLLWEQQSTVDPLMPLRVLIYLGRIWDRWLRGEETRRKKAGDHSSPTQIPAVLPVVLYQGPGGWSAATDFLDLVDLPGDLRDAVREHLPSFRFVLDDLSQQDDQALRRREAGPLGRLALVLLKHAREREEALLAALERIQDLLEQLEGEQDRVLVLSYILEVTEVGPDGLQQRLGNERVREAVVTAAEKLRQEGKLDSRREILLRQLGAKAQGELSPELKQRVAQASLTELDTWLDRVVSAATVDEVFAAE